MDEFSEEQKSLSSLLLDALRIKSLTVERLSELTNVSERFITLLLEEQFDKMPPAPYVHGYLMKIAEILHLDGEMLWKEYAKDHNRILRSGAKDMLPPNRFLTPKLNKKWALGGVVALLIVIYAIARGPALLGKPLLTIENIPDALSVESASFTIQGKMNPSDELTINKEVVYSDKEGNFSYTLTLQEGFNAIEFMVKNVLGRNVTETKQIFYKAPQAHSTIPLNNATTEENISE